jgi:hypothetical protein
MEEKKKKKPERWAETGEFEELTGVLLPTATVIEYQDV